MANQEKKIKVFDIVPSSHRPEPIKQKVPEAPMISVAMPEAQASEEEQKPQEEVGKEFLSKWFYKKKKAAIVKEETPEQTEEIEITSKKEIIAKPIEEENDDDDFLKDEISPVKTGIKFGKYIVIALILIIVADGTYVALEILPKAEIKITAKKTPWNFNNSVFASKNSGNIDLTNKQIPANFFSEKKNVSLSYPATGKKNVEKKAEGEITIYNAYSSQSQSLIANTRFESLDGKIFRIQEKITVPGAKVENGKITASGVKAKVVADKIGAEYNIGPTKFTIPGFKGTPKYDGFYAKSENQMTGGFVGEFAYPTDDEIKTAKEKTASVLEQSLTTVISSQIPADFKIIEGARQFNIIREDVNQEVNQEGNFSVFAEGELTMAGFKESDLLELMDGLAQKELGENFKAKEYSLEYGVARPDIQSGKINFSINYSGTFWQPIDIEQFKNSILNKKETELKVFVFSLSGVERATVSLWPFWAKSVPDNIAKVKAEVE